MVSEQLHNINESGIGFLARCAAFAGTRLPRDDQSLRRVVEQPEMKAKLQTSPFPVRDPLPEHTPNWRVALQ